MEPQIRYVQSADGTRIATWSLGQGRPLVYLSYWFYTIEMLWQIPEARANLERLAQKRRVVLYDPRGAGLSSRDATDYSLGARVADLEAVVASLGEAQVDLMAGVRTSAVAIAYAAMYAEKVHKLVLTSPVVGAASFFVTSDERLRVLEPLAETDWEVYLQCRALILFGWTDLGRRVAEQQGKEVTHEVHVKNTEAARQDDVTSLLPQVRCPTLVMVRRGGRALQSKEKSKELAAVLTNARLVTFQLEHIMFLGGEWDSALRIVAEFLDEDEAVEERQLPSGTAVILFLDIAGSTELTTQLGDTAYREKERQLDGALRQAISEAGGSPVEGKVLGDGVMATFAAAKDAIEAALNCQSLGDGAGLSLHAGIHAGDVIREGNNVHGGAVQVAARIADASAPGEVLVSQTVRDLARTSAGVTFEDRGEQSLKGVSEPVRVFAVRSE